MFYPVHGFWSSRFDCLPCLFLYSEAARKKAQEYAARRISSSVNATQPNTEQPKTVSPQSDQSTTQIYTLVESNETRAEGPDSVTNSYVLLGMKLPTCPAVLSIGYLN